MPTSRPRRRRRIQAGRRPRGKVCDLSGRFGTRAYAVEELIAELGAAFLCVHLQIPGQLRHAAYIASWLELLENDRRAIFTAAGAASKAAEYLRSLGAHGSDRSAAAAIGEGAIQNIVLSFTPGVFQVFVPRRRRELPPLATPPPRA